ncbi:hypothetical protein EHS25_005773 [Saitozyma podzolica]|uniref:Uncharacterized protein n=1 Tax=Saitozyma podzolica TaxID=1890683 RepID=A0A427XW59_9TREE|nr:hypothetical protein EHS25_005773 [Saitozyma podzolica]
MANGSSTKGKQSADKQTKDAPRQSLKRRSQQGLQDPHAISSHFCRTFHPRCLVTLHTSSSPPLPSLSPRPSGTCQSATSVRLRVSDSDSGSESDSPPVTAASIAGRRRRIASLEVDVGSESADLELSQSILRLALPEEQARATVTEGQVANATEPSRSLRPAPIDLTDLPDTPPSSTKLLAVKPEPYSPPPAPPKLPLVRRHSHDDINESSPYRSQAKISLAHAKAHTRNKRNQRFGLNEECWDIAWNHAGFREDYLVSQRIGNKTALEYILNIALIGSAFDLPHPKFTAMPGGWDHPRHQRVLQGGVAGGESQKSVHPVPRRGAQGCQRIFTGYKEAPLGSLTPEQAKAVVEASSKLGRVWHTTIPFQPSLRLTDFEVAIALQLRTLTGEREAHCTCCGEANFFGHPEACLQRKFRRVARHEGAKHIMGQALASTPGTRDTDPSRLANKYLDSVADHKVRHRPTSNLPFHPIVFSLGGMMNGSTTKVFASWKRARVRSFEL